MVKRFAGCLGNWAARLPTRINLVININLITMSHRGIFNKTHLLSLTSEASKLRSLPFTHPIYVASRYFQ